MKLLIEVEREFMKFKYWVIFVVILAFSAGFGMLLLPDYKMQGTSERPEHLGLYYLVLSFTSCGLSVLALLIWIISLVKRKLLRGEAYLLVAVVSAIVTMWSIMIIDAGLKAYRRRSVGTLLRGVGNTPEVDKIGEEEEILSERERE